MSQEEFLETAKEILEKVDRAFVFFTHLKVLQTRPLFFREEKNYKNRKKRDVQMIYMFIMFVHRFCS